MAVIARAGTPSPHLADLVADVDRLAGRCTGADAEVVAVRRDEAALASLRLDGSPISRVPTADELAAAHARIVAVERAEDRRAGTWFDAMRTFEGPDPDDPEAAAHDLAVHALEFAGVLRATAADDLAGGLFDDATTALPELHRRLTLHLVAPDRAGQLRTVDQAVHDAAVGRILYFTVPPDRLADELADLAAWLAEDGRREHPLVAAGIVHLELLRLHPFDAANGRLARAAGRLLLREGGLDPDGLAAPEPELDGDRLGYHDEVARTLRRRDPTVWLERWGEAVAAGLRRSARALGRADGPGTSLPTEVGATFTLADHLVASGLDRAAAGTQLRALLDAGDIAYVPGSRGLRFRRTG